MHVHGDLIIPIPGVRFLPSFPSTRLFFPPSISLFAYSCIDSFFALPYRPQTKSIKYLEENFASRDVELSEDDLKAVREIIENNPVLGEQYNAKFAAMIDRN